MADAKILAKGLKLLETLAQSANGMSAANLAEKIDVHKSSVYRYLNTLLKAGYILSDEYNRYHLGNKILELGSQKLRRMPVREVARPFLVELSSTVHKTAHLCVLDGCDIVYIDKVESYKTLPMMSRIGSRAPAYCTAVGKALLSSLPADQQITLLRSVRLQQLTPSTIIDPMQLLDELKKTARRGYAIDNEEHEVGIKCIAAPINGYAGNCVAAISLTGLARDLDPQDEFERLAAAVKTAAIEISQELGYWKD